MISWGFVPQRNLKGETIYYRKDGVPYTLGGNRMTVPTPAPRERTSPQSSGRTASCACRAQQ